MKGLVDMHGGTFTFKSRLREGTEVIITLPPERVMSGLAPLEEPAPPIAPRADATTQMPSRANAPKSRGLFNP